MKITLKCFAYLSQYLPEEATSNVIAYEVGNDTNVQQVIDLLNLDNDMVELAILNDVFIDPNMRAQTQLKEGDILALWPEVAGG